jgi:hypothetical protein
VAQAEQYMGFPSNKEEQEDLSFAHQGNGGTATQVPAILDRERPIINSTVTVNYGDSRFRRNKLQSTSVLRQEVLISYCSTKNARFMMTRLYVFG